MAVHEEGDEMHGLKARGLCLVDQGASMLRPRIFITLHATARISRFKIAPVKFQAELIFFNVFLPAEPLGD